MKLDLVGISDIAKMLGVSRQRVLQMKIAETLPTPDGHLGNRGTYVWRRATIERWLARREEARQ